MEARDESARESSRGYVMEIQAQLSQIQRSLKVIEDTVKKPGGRQRAFWVERIMYWLIVIGLIVAVIKLA
jgi:hypothetical protein